MCLERRRRKEERIEVIGLKGVIKRGMNLRKRKKAVLGLKKGERIGICVGIDEGERGKEKKIQKEKNKERINEQRKGFML